MAQPSRSIHFAITLVIALALSFPASAAIIPPLKQPTWAELTPQQREVLAPLAGEWDKLESYRRKKWLGIVQRYPTMTVEKQQRLQKRMKDWASLSPEERKRAREQYKTLKKEPPGQRQAVKQKWQEYKNLPDAEKKKLQQRSKAQPKSGARKAVKTAPAASPQAIAPTPPAKSQLPLSSGATPSQQ